MIHGQKNIKLYLESVEMWWCWRPDQISWTDRVRYEAALQRVKQESNILHTKQRNCRWVGHILRRNCLLKHVIEGKIGRRKEETGRWGRRRKQLLQCFSTFM